ncbi:hypothetical protein [Conexibacter sp. CPCC 206217]|uniref:phosphoribosyltransferase-like protein n=1 Tax=Conexibacter sp. CPCC 206217 TaxID=3064574 RepID=UPI002723CBA8|nr:hypothetical protein [Conexibacter sp. CPCC 206217]MDO8209642.1 hypothetical protein [Conexibacter sp. CPCC 206217]
MTSTMRPSETSDGRAWLRNFHRSDAELATVVLDRLRFLSLGDLHDKLQRFLDQPPGSIVLERPALVVPERNLSRLEEEMPDPANAVAWRDFEPGGPISLPSGSDGFVGMVLRDFAPRGRRPISDSGLIAPTAGIEELRQLRCRSIVILTDYVGSGSQAQTLAAAIARHPTIRSWRALGVIKIHVAAVAAQRIGIERLRASRSVDHVHELEVAPSIWTTFPDRHVQQAVIDLCEGYSAKGWRALGYDDAAALFVTQRSAPNNLPAIFLQQGPAWQPLFPGRKIPKRFASELGAYRPSERLEELAERVGHLRLGRNERLRSMRRSSRALLHVLTQASREASDALRLAEGMGIDVAEAAAYLVVLQDWGFLDGSGRITPAGRTELTEHRKGRRRTTAHLAGSSEPYYPLALR